MKAWRVYEAGDIRCDELKSQSVGENCVKVKITCSTISPTDKSVFEGKLSADKLPLIVGRQCVGMVTEVGENVLNVVRGDRVAVDPYGFCKQCANCKAGKQNECEKMLTYGVDEDGFMRDFVVVGSDDVYKLPDRVRDEDAAFIDHIAISLAALNKITPEKGEHIVIVGANVVGIILAQVAMYQQAVPILVDTREDKLALAEELGVYYTVNSVDSNVQKKIFSLTGGRMADSVAHIASSQLPFSLSLEYVRRGGKTVIVDWGDAEDDNNVSMKPVLSKQLSLYGVNNGAKNIPSAINMLANRTVSVERLVSKEIPFAEVGKYIKEQTEMPDKYIKILVKN